MSLIEDGLYGTFHSRGESNAAPRRQLRVHGARDDSRVSQVASVTPLPRGAAQIDAPAASAPPTQFSTELVTARPLVPKPESEAPLAANSVPTQRRMLISNDRGMEYDTPERVHNKTPAYMNHLNRKLDRSEVNPYTGEREDYYKSLPPDANKDYRVPQSAMQNVNLKLMHMQGYDHSKPKPARKEKLGEIPQPDGSWAEAATFNRRMGEMAERVTRDVNVNMNGERPSWMKDHQRPFGYHGYQDMNRMIPNVPATARADTKPFAPHADQVNNPRPANEIKVRGRHRSNAARPHVEKVVDHRGPAGAATGAAPSIGAHTGQDTKRSNTENVFVVPGPSQGPAQPSMNGETSALTHRKGEQVRDTERYATTQLTGVGAVDDWVSDEALRRIQSRHGNKVDGQEGSVRTGHSVQGAQVATAGLPPMLHDEPTAKRAGQAGKSMSHPAMDNPFLKPPQVPTASDLSAQHRSAIPTNLATDFSYEAYGIDAPPMIPTATDLRTNYRTDVGGAVMQGFAYDTDTVKQQPYRDGQYAQAMPKRHATLGAVPAGHGLQANAVLASPAISRMIEHDATRRSQTAVIGTQYASRMDASAAGGTTAFEHTHVGQSRKFEGAGGQVYVGNAQSASLGASKHGEQPMLDIGGRRAQYGAVSATSFLHGGGEGMAMQPGRGADSMDRFTNAASDRTTTRDMRGEARNRAQAMFV